MELRVNRTGIATSLDDVEAAVEPVKTEIRPRRRIFTPATIEIVRELARRGKSAPEIAVVIGSTPASVRVKCCHLKIKLMRGRRSRAARTERPDAQKLTVYMQPAAYAAFADRTAQMQKSTPELAAMLLEAIVRSDLYAAVLDEAE